MEAAPNTLGSSNEATSPTSRIRGSGGSVVVVERKEETTQSILEDIMGEEVIEQNTVAGLSGTDDEAICNYLLLSRNTHFASV